MIQVKHIKWIHNNRFLASKDASKRRHMENKRKDIREEGEEKAKVFENRFRSGGEENERRMANNVMRGRRVCDGYLVCLDLSVDLPSNSARNPSCYLLSTVLVFP